VTARVARVRGEVEILPLALVTPNGWNPNEMTPALMASLEQGFVEDGWLVNQALLVWGTDETGQARNLIIDGEHRWLAANHVGLTEGPMVVLDGLTEVEAKALTVKLDQKRGSWDMDKLKALVQDLAAQSETGLNAASLGFGEEELMKLMPAPEELEAPAVEEIEAPPMSEEEKPEEPKEDKPAPVTSDVRMVQLFLDDASHPLFASRAADLGKLWGTETVTDTVLKAVEKSLEKAHGSKVRPATVAELRSGKTTE